MKTIKIFACMFLLSIASTVNAQFTNSSASGNVASAPVDNKGWSGLNISYNSTEIDMDIDDLDNVSGIEFGYTWATPIMGNTPLFLESGLGAIYTFGDLFDKYNYSISTSLLSVKANVNLGYKFNLKENIAIFPYAGVYLRGNISGTMTFDMDGEEEEFDLFDEDEGDCDRLQYGLNIGAKCIVNKFTLGVAYGFDLNELGDDINVSTLSFNVGFNF